VDVRNGVLSVALLALAAACGGHGVELEKLEDAP
jgi:hypothetical protein